MNNTKSIAASILGHLGGVAMNKKFSKEQRRKWSAKGGRNKRGWRKAKAAAAMALGIFFFFLFAEALTSADHYTRTPPASPRKISVSKVLRRWKKNGEPLPIHPISHHRDGTLKVGTASAYSAGLNPKN